MFLITRGDSFATTWDLASLAAFDRDVDFELLLLPLDESWFSFPADWPLGLFKFLFHP